jgi:hypothetical protein
MKYSREITQVKYSTIYNYAPREITKKVILIYKQNKN